MLLCITMELPDGQHASVLNERLINVSRHKDYSLYHWKAYDVKALKAPIDKFAFLDTTGALLELIEAAQLKRRGVNYATAERASLELTEEEAVQIARAVDLVNARQASGTVATADKVTPPGEVAAEELGDQAVAEVVDSIDAAAASDAAAEEDGVADEDAPAVDAASHLRPKKRKRR